MSSLLESVAQSISMKRQDRTDAIVDLEERASSIYLNFARRFSLNPQLSWFWLTMSMDEKQHAVLLKFCGDEKILAGNFPDSKKIQELSDLFSRLEKRAQDRKLSMEDAFRIATELERSEVNDIYSGLIRPVQGTPYILRKKIQALRPGHMRSLIQAARKFGLDVSTIGRIIQSEPGKIRTTAGNLEMQEALKELHEQLPHPNSVHEADRDLVRQLRKDVGALLKPSARGSSREYESLMGRLQDATKRFEVSHPELTAVIGRVIDSLSAVGI